MKWNKKRFITIYTLVYGILFFTVFLAFYINGKGFMWTVDSLPEHMPKVIYFKKFMTEIVHNFLNGHFVIPSYDFALGMGTDVSNHISIWFFEPINLIYMFVDLKHFELVYNCMVLVRFYLVGLCFCAYCYYRKKDMYPTIIGSVIYAFCGFALVGGVRHHFYLVAMMLLPLLCIAVEEVLKGRRRWFLAILIALSAEANLYYLYMNTIFIGIYYLCRYRDYHETFQLKYFLKSIWKMFTGYFMGIGLAAIFILPNAISIVTSARMGSTLSKKELLYYGDNHLLRMLSMFVMPDETTGYWLRMSFAAIALFAVILLFVRYRKGRRLGLKIMFALGIVFAAIPVFGFVFSGFSCLCNRWCYAFAFLIGYIVTTMLPEMFQVKRKEMLYFVGATGVYLLVVIGHYVVDMNVVTSWIGLAMIVVTLIGLWMLNRTWKESVRSYLVILAMVMICVSINGYTVYGEKYGNYVAQFTTFGEGISNIEDTPLKVADQLHTNSFERVAEATPTRNTLSAALINGYHGITFYNNVMDRNINRFNTDMESWSHSKVNTRGFDNRVMLNALAGVGYYVVEKGEEDYIPYGYEKEQTIMDDNRQYIVYHNKFTLPIAYTYDNAIDIRTFKEASALDRQEMMMQSVVLDDTSNVKINNNVQLHEQEVPVRFGVSKGYYKNKVIHFDKENGKLIISLKTKKNAEMYLRFKDIGIADKGQNHCFMNLYVSCGTKQRKVQLRGKQNTYYLGQDNYLYNLGYYKDAENITCEIRFPRKMNYTLDSVEGYAVPMKSYAEQVEKLRENTMQYVKIKDNQISGQIDLPLDKILCFSIPYSEGWTCYVDGRKTKLLKANDCYMAVPLTKGRHEIQLKYHAPGIMVGGFISLFSIFIFGGRIVYGRKKRAYQALYHSTLL